MGKLKIVKKPDYEKIENDEETKKNIENKSK